MASLAVLWVGLVLGPGQESASWLLASIGAPVGYALLVVDRFMAELVVERFMASLCWSILMSCAVYCLLAEASSSAGMDSW